MSYCLLVEEVKYTFCEAMKSEEPRVKLREKRQYMGRTKYGWGRPTVRKAIFIIISTCLSNALNKDAETFCQAL